MFALASFTPAVRMVGTMAFATKALPKVAVIGAAGGIGQPLSLLLKVSPHVGDLALLDVANVVGVAADLSHINTQGKVSGHLTPDMGAGLKGAKLVVIPAGVPRKPGMTRDDLFNTNASIVKSLAQACATHCPEAFFLIISNPVNSTVPIFAEVLKKAGVYNKNKLFGVTSLDVSRANTFVGEHKKSDPAKENVTVVGGHAGTTILPLLSQLKGVKFSDAELVAIIKRIQFGGDEVVEAKNGTGSATLSMAYAGAKFAEAVLRAAAGEKNVTECTFVESPVAAKDGCAFFASPVTLGPNGVEKIHPIGAMSAREEANYKTMIGELKSQIAKGVEFANK